MPGFGSPVNDRPTVFGSAGCFRFVVLERVLGSVKLSYTDTFRFVADGV